MKSYIPVGIEYKFTENKKWAARFGSIFTYATSTYDYSAHVTSSVPRTTKTEYNSQNTTVTIEPNNFNSSSRKVISSLSQTVFTYGLGYTPTENLQIDVIGFFSINNNVTLLEYMKSLRLSFVLKW